jgi:hypothetical protein
VQAWLNKDTVQALQAVILAASQSYAGFFALATIMLAIALLILNTKRKGMGTLEFAAFALFVGFVISAGAAVYYGGTEVVKVLYYAGRDGNNYNVGRFLKRSATEWVDTNLASIALDGAGNPIDAPIYHYVVDDKQTIDNDIYMNGTDEGREGVVIEIDMNQRTISYIENGRSHLLYHIIAP